MKKWRNITLVSLIILLCFIVYVNIKLFTLRDEAIPQDKIAEINRMYQELQQGKQLQDVKHDDVNVYVVNEKDMNLNLYMNHAKERMIVLPTGIEDSFYVFEYSVKRLPIETIWSINVFMLGVFVFLLIIIFFVSSQILRPFQKFEYIAQAMRNRDFTYELPKQRNQFFGKFIWAVDVMREELRHHEEKEMQLMKENKLMIASISHDIKTPLSTIRLYSDTLLDELYTKEIIRQRINENCDKIDGFIKEIQHTNSEHLFDFDVVIEDVYLHELWSLLEIEKERILLKKIKYSQTSYQDVLVHCDVHRMKEVIGNVMDNAMKYGDGLWIHVDVYEEEHHLMIAIKNSGSGIEEQDQNAIFQSFYRGNNIKKEKGNGLGLYICKQLMKKMDGDIFMTQGNQWICFHIVLEML